MADKNNALKLHSSLLGYKYRNNTWLLRISIHFYISACYMFFICT